MSQVSSNVSSLLDEARTQAMAGQVARLESTLAAYVFADGTIPSAIDAETPLMQVVPSALLPEFWVYLARYLGEGIQSPDVKPRLSVERRSAPRRVGGRRRAQ